MQLSCPHCKIDLHPADVDFDALDATCRRCGWRFGVAVSPYRRAGDPQPVETATEPEPNALQPDARQPGLVHRQQRRSLCPAHVQIDEAIGGRSLTIRWRELNGWTLFNHLATAVVGGFMLVGWDTRNRGFAVFVGALVCAVGAYLSFRNIFNTRIIEVDAEALRVRSVPLPSLGRRIARSEIDQLFVNKNFFRQRGRPPTYVLKARLKSGRTATLVRMIHTPQQALFLEQELERYMGITNVPVAGEITE